MMIALAISACKSKEERFVDHLMHQMTFEEQLGQLNLLSAYGEIVTGISTGDYDPAERIAKGEVGGILNLSGVDKIREAQRIAVEKSRLGIPLIFGLDVIHGYKTIFPIPLAMSCSWDTAAIRQSAQVAAREATADGICWTFSPMVDICWDARWGRIAEGNGEDPFLGSAIAKVMVEGYQGKDLTDSTTLMACVKHFALYGGAEAGRDYNTVDMSEYRMANDYMPPYKAAIDAGCGSVMAAFNTLNGLPCHCNPWLLNTLLRDQWKFDGFVVSDYTAILELIKHRMGPDLFTVGERSLQAGCDMDMVSEALNIQTDRRAVRQACRRILIAKYRLGLFDDPYRYCNSERRATDIYIDANRQLARQLATESFVLLKNKAVLPLQESAKVALIGPLADTRANMPGTWSVTAAFDRCRTLREAFEQVLPKGHFFYAKGSNIFYDAQLEARGSMFGREIRDNRSAATLRAEAMAAARQADVIVLAMGETSELSGECTSRTDLNMPDAQRDLIDALATLHKPMVLLNFSGRPVILTHENEVCDAILQVWFGGSETADAVADVVFGKVSPSGKLTTSFPRSVGQEPLYYRQLSTGRPSQGSFEKFLTCYIDESMYPLFPFGYGLSYTTFEYSECTMQDARCTVKVTNTGKMAGAEVVQLYVRAQHSTLARPVKELRGFKRVFLEPGETAELSFDITPETLGYYTDLSTFVVERGVYDIFLNTDKVGEVTIK
ncbi:MAG: beta-glucosidase BglX [Bacteroidales bacterium]|nr:beta-glucosidase BglX [Bacteroidales bacterium]